MAQAQEHKCAAHKLQQLAQAPKASRATTSDALAMQKYNVQHYHLNIAATNNSLTIAGATTIKATTVLPLDTFVFELSTAHTIDSIIYNNTTITKIHSADVGYALLPSTIAANTPFSITIHYHGTCPNTGASAIGYGFNTDTSPSWGNSVVWSLSQPFSAYQWWPCKQSLQDKADSSSVYITTSNLNKAASNGLLVGIDSLPANKVTYKWHSRYPIDYYLISVAISGYVDYSIYAKPTALVGDSILIQNYVYDNPGTLTSFKNRIDTIAKMVELYSNKVSLYPFWQEKYGVAMAPFTGGMEHQTMSSQGFYEFSLNAHELFHQWFGDHVTCKSWSDIWINEGFASYGEYIALENLRSKADAQADMVSVHNRIMSQPGGSIFFTDTTNTRIFSSRLSYDKGGAVIHTLRYLLGDSIFYKTLGTFQNLYANSTASITDFKTVAETISGQNLNNYFNEWIYGEGYPTYNTLFASNGSNIVVQITHGGSVAANNLYTTPLQVLCKSNSGDTLVTLPITSNIQKFVLPSKKIITSVVIDPNNWIINAPGSIALNNDLVSSISNNNLLQISIHPIPAVDKLYLKNCPHNVQGIITNHVGAIVFTGAVTNNCIPVATLPNGNYILRLADANNNFTNQQFIVQH